MELFSRTGRTCYGFQILIRSKEEDNNDDDDDDDAMYECVCPNCGDTIMLGENIIADGSIECPNCGESLEFDFSEIEDEDNED